MKELSCMSLEQFTGYINVVLVAGILISAFFVLSALFPSKKTD